MATLRRFHQLPRDRQRLALRTLVVVAIVRAGLALVSFSRMKTAVKRSADRWASHPRGPTSTPEELTWAVGAASRVVPGATCLVQALALQLLLSRSGQPAELCIGVAKANGDLEAHAWIESGGRRFLEDTEPARFAPLPGGWQA